MRKTALAAGGLALVLALGACGSKIEAGHASPQATGGAAAQGQLFGDAQSLSLAASTKTTSAKTAKFSLNMASGGQSINGQGQGRFDGANSALSMTTTVAGMSMEVRLVDGTTYVKLPDEARAATGGKPWAKVT